jgi:amino acid adenylation domain-containing protein
VDVSHGAARNTVDALNDRFGIGPQDRTLAVSGLDFDLSVYDLFGPLCAGGAVICVGEDERRDAARWSELAERHHATVLNSVPAVLDMLLTVREEQHRPLGLRLLLLGGDWVGLDLPGRAHRRDPDCRFVALGGTTETAIHSTVCEVGEVPGQWRSIPYGVPLPNQQCRVVDAGGRDRPDGVAGELWIGGLGVAEGYHGDPDRTADRFVRHDSTRWYRTGDLARYHPDGTLEFLGRADFQVKISGYRIEPGEIQHALEAHPRVSAAVVCTVGETAPRLVAMAAASGVTAGEVREFLTLRLPPYMVPERIEMVAALPLSRNGKVDRAAVAAGLRDAGTVPDGTASEAAHGDVEVALAALWAELLAVSRVGRTDSFFALGGDSLLATRLLTRLGAAGLHGAQLGTLFRGPTLGEFAATLTRGAPQRLTHVVADPAARGEPFPATEVQRAYWLGRNPEFTLGGVGSSWYWEFDGSGVDLDRLERCWNQVVRRHEMMRAVFDDDARQRILPETPWVRLPVDDAGPGGEQESLRRLRESMAHRVFDVRQWPLFDVRAVRYGDRCRIGFGFDYIVLDALSIMIIFWELSALYRDPDAVLPPLGVSFRDYVLQVRPEPETRARDERYWLDRIATLPPAPRLPMAIDPALLDEPRFTRWEFHLSAERWRDLLARAAGHGLTPSTVLATAFAEVLATWSAGPQVALNLTMFDRREVHPDINNILGDFTSLLLVGHHSRPGRSWADTARELQQQVWDALEHSSVPAVWVLREMARTAGVAELLMPVVFTSTLGVSDQLAELDIPFGEQVWGLSQTPQVSLDCQVVERDGGLSINWDVVADLFPDGVVDAMFGSYRALVERLATASWDEPAVPLLPPAQAAIRAAVGTPVRPESGDLLHHGFFARAADRPGAPALHVEGGAAVTYGDLADLARRTASTLISRGVRPGDPVAVCLPKGAGQIVAVLAVLAAGGVYVPIGAEQPAVRRNRILRAAGARIVIAEPGPDEAVWDPSAEVVDPLTAARAARLEHLVEVAGADLAYVIFTSGSTGEPKGVEISHRSAVNTVEDVNDRYGVGPADVGLALSALDFDLSVYDIFGLLGAGGSLVLIDDAGRREARRWAELVTGHGVTVWNTVPALLDMLLVAGADDLPPATLRLVLVSGDWVGLDLPGRLAAAAPLAELVALGGATEAAIWSNAYDVSGPLPDWQSIPYGLPLRNQRYRVVGENGADCPDWVPGELWIGGTGVAAGYRGDPARTAERFVEHLGVRWYRTGDLGRYRPGGLLEFLGRLDQQVKVRGNRIELGEVETALRRHPGLEGAVAGTAGERTARRLVAFVTAAEPVDEADVRAFVTELLPGYMVPEQILQVPAFPLSANGKVDRAALAVAVPQSGPAGREPPRAGAEREVAALWSELLGLPTVDRADSFFAVGGDSLTATRLVELVRERMGPRLTLRQIFAAPTLAVLAALVQSERTAVRSPSADPIEEGVL